jgi:hypothetical protein
MLLFCLDLGKMTAFPWKSPESTPSLPLTLPRNSYLDPATLFGRQEDLQSPLCRPSCDLRTCGSGGSCSLGSILKREWSDGLLFNNNSDYHGNVRALGKRLFTFNAGSTDPKDASGRRQPRRKEVDVYLPAVFDGMEPYYGNPLPTVAVGGTFRYMPTLIFPSLISCFRVTL